MVWTPPCDLNDRLFVHYLMPFNQQIIQLMYSGDLKSDHSKSGLFEGRISNCPYVVGFQIVPTIRKPENMVDLVQTVLYINNFFAFIKNSLGYMNHSTS